MMMNKRLIGMVPESRKYVAGCVAIQWANLIVNSAAMTAAARTLAALYARTLTAQGAAVTALVLLDEPTSNLDSLNEAVILRALKREKDRRAIVLVSHRPSTMATADRHVIESRKEKKRLNKISQT